jgi:hypothetical protein
MSSLDAAVSPKQNFASLGSIQPRGIGCESCHGPASNWLDKHYQRDVGAEQRTAWGMNATRNLLVRSQTCAACHVGSDDNDMNHDMIAAGHPALRFEMGSYHGRLPKHWPVAERLANSDFHAQLWAAGQIASTDAALRLLAGRAERAARADNESTSASWPEFSEYSCLSCHQRLRSSEDEQRLRWNPSVAQSIGQPAWTPWSGAVPLLIGRSDAEGPGGIPSEPWVDLREQMRRLSSTNASMVAGLAQMARTELNAALGYRSSSTAYPPPIVFTNQDLIAASRQAAAQVDNWEAMCQVFLALQAALRGCEDAFRRSIASGDLYREPRPILLVEILEACHHDLEAMRWSLAFQTEADLPRTMSLERVKSPEPTEPLSKGHSVLTMGQIRQLAMKLADRLDTLTTVSKLWEGEAPAEP